MMSSVLWQLNTNKDNKDDNQRLLLSFELIIIMKILHKQRDFSILRLRRNEFLLYMFLIYDM